METAKFYSAFAFAAGLLVTLFLAAYLTPRQWWRRPNARALLVLVAGSWGFGSLILFMLNGAHPAAASETTAMTAATTTTTTTPTAAAPSAAAFNTQSAASRPFAELVAGQPFQVHRALNLRGAAGVHAARLLTVPAGATVTPTGVRMGDWWQIKTNVTGQDTTGWANSLWLRRSGE